jgi:3-oxoacyl-[acyl-carrier-protein] synthase-3
MVACEDVLSKIGWARDTIDAIIMVTQSSDYIIPSSSIIVQDQLGLPTTCAAFDINLGCSGYPYGLFAAGRFLGENSFKRVLVVIGDQSASDGAQDSGREILFSDAATVTALEYAPGAPPMYFEGFSDGSGHKAIYVPHGGKRSPVTPTSMEPKMCADGVIRSDIDVYLNGPAILNFSIMRGPQALSSILEFAGLKSEEVDGFYLHQANRMINETIRKKMKVEADRMPESLHDFGNTSSASVPVTLAHRHPTYLSEKGRKLVMCGFGIGLSWASLALTTTGDCYSSGIIEDV